MRVAPISTESGVRVKLTRTNLAAPPFPLVGRAAELEVLAELGRRERLVSIVGPAGIGKSRLAQEHALRSLDSYLREGGVWHVDLRAGVAPLDVAVAIGGAAFAAREVGRSDAGQAAVETLAGRALEGDAPLARLVARLSGRGRTLIVVDVNDEPRELARVLSTLLPALRHVQFIVTTGAPLGIPGEARLDLGPLALPRPGGRPDGSDAVALLTRRSGAIPRAGELVTQLQGNPLAIELAGPRAARVDMHVRVDPGLEPHAAVVQAGLEALWLDLSAPDRDALTHLSVFAGGFDRLAAMAVLALTEADTEAALASLVARHALTAHTLPHHRGRARFAMHPTVRAFARARLTAPEVPSERHARHFVQQAAARLRAWDVGDDAEARAWFALETENLRAIQAREEVPAPLALEAAVLLDPWLAEVAPPEVRAQHLGRALEPLLAADAAPALVARGLVAQGEALACTEERARALAILTEAVQRAPDAELAARAHLAVGRVHLRGGRADDGRSHLERATALAREARDGLLEGRALSALGEAHLAAGQLDAAAGTLERARALHRAASDRRFERTTLGLLGAIEHEHGRLTEATALLEAALALHRAIGDGEQEALLLGRLASLQHEAGGSAAPDRTPTAVYARALEAHARAGTSRDALPLVLGFAALQAEEGDLDTARAATLDALGKAELWGDRESEARAHLLISAMAAAEGAIDAAEAAHARAAARAPASSVALQALLELGHGHLARARAAARASADAGEAEVQQRVERAIPAARTHSELRRAMHALRPSPAKGGAHAAPVESAREARWEDASTDRAGRFGNGGSSMRLSARAPSLDGLDLPANALLVCGRAQWFRVPYGEAVSVHRWKSLQNLLAKLADVREQAPGATLTVDDLIAAGWPGERILPKAGATRVYTALSTLRRLGLRDLLVRGDRGYAFDPQIPLMRVNPSEE